MTSTKLLKLFITVLSTITFIFGAPTTCSRELGSGISGENDAFWMENIKHQGISAFNSDPSKYQVFRNVKVSAYALRISMTEFDRISARKATVSRTTLQQ
jgi:hypothetical protein